MRVSDYTTEQISQFCKESFSYAEVLRKMKMSGGGSQATLKKRIKKDKIDVSHFKGHGWNKGLTGIGPNKEKYTLDEVFKKDSPVSQKVLRGYIERHNIIPYKCERCGCDGHWQGGQISLEIHHKDGNNKNNCLNNLCYLCPNCHALTDTYRGKNISSK